MHKYFLGSIIIIFLLGVPLSSYSQNLENNLQTSVQISKYSTNSYSIVNETAFIKPFFDISYIITGSSNSLNHSQEIINSTIVNDFNLSPTIGYILQQNNTSGESANVSSTLSTLPNPFVDRQTISDKIQQQLSDAINSAINIDYFEVDIKCTFGNNIAEWECNVYSLPS